MIAPIRIGGLALTALFAAMAVGDGLDRLGEDSILCGEQGAGVTGCPQPTRPDLGGDRAA